MPSACRKDTSTSPREGTTYPGLGAVSQSSQSWVAWAHRDTGVRVLARESFPFFTLATGSGATRARGHTGVCQGSVWPPKHHTL